MMRPYPFIIIIIIIIITEDVFASKKNSNIFYSRR